MIKLGMMKTYKAFISYSHTDSEVAAWLHKKLETYKAPAGVTTASGEPLKPDSRLFPVFRDEEELPTSADLGASIRNALNNSEMLIVLCSPAAARSRWVNEEVLYFKQQGKAARIFCLLLGGEPNATDKGLDENMECFPPAIRFEVLPDGQLGPRRMEPMAADLRSGNSRTGYSITRHTAFMKLVAGCFNVPFDSLAQREQSRRRRTWVQGAVALSTIIGGLGVFSFKWWEANNQQLEQKQVTAEVWDTLQQGFQGSYVQPDLALYAKTGQLTVPLTIHMQADLNAVPPEGLTVLKDFAAQWMARPAPQHLTIAGHVSHLTRKSEEEGVSATDTVGGFSDAYSLAIAQRSAESVRAALEQLGVPAQYLTTMSYGKFREVYSIALQNNRVEISIDQP